MKRGMLVFTCELRPIQKWYIHMRHLSLGPEPRRLTVVTGTRLVGNKRGQCVRKAITTPVEAAARPVKPRCAIRKHRVTPAANGCSTSPSIRPAGQPPAKPHSCHQKAPDPPPSNPRGRQPPRGQGTTVRSGGSIRGRRMVFD